MKISVVIVLLLLLSIYAECQSFHNLRGSLDTDHERFTSRRTSSSSGKSGGVGFWGFLFGPVLFVMSFVVIWFNQKKAAIDYRRLEKAKDLVDEVNPFVMDQVRAANGKLVHITGDTQTNQPLFDRLTGIQLNNVVKLERQVEVKEWRGREEGNDDSRHVVYDLVWASSNQEHSHARHNSPANWFIQNQSVKVPEVAVGNYFLNDNQKDRLVCRETYSPQMQNAFNILQGTGRQVPSQPQIIGNYIYFPSEPGNYEAPGSLRVKFNFCPNGPISIIAESTMNTFKPFRIDIYDNDGQPDEEQGCWSCCCCTMSSCIAVCLKPIQEIDLLEQEKLSYQEMMDAEMKQAQCRTNAVRLLSFVMMVAGICLLFSPITTLLGYIPLVGGFLKSAVGFVILVAAVIVCLPLWILATGISWVCHHPKVGIAILVIGLVVAGIIIGISASSGGDGMQSTPPKHMFTMLRNHI